MPRATNNPASRERRRKVLKRAKGFRGGRSKLIRTAMETVKRAMAYAYAHRRQKKRTMRSLWITRLSAACKLNGMSYSRFINGLVKAGVKLDRRILAEIAVCDKDGFAKIVGVAKEKVA